MARFENLTVGNLTVTSKVVDQSTAGEPQFILAGLYTIPTGGTTATLSLANVNGADVMLGHFSVTDDTDTFNQIQAGNGRYLYKLSADPLTAHEFAYCAVRNNVTSPGVSRYAIFAAGTFTTAGGDASETITVTGMTADDIAFVGTKTLGSTPRYLAAAKAAAGQINVTLSGDPTTDHVLSYMVLRPAGSFRPSHIIAAAGTTAATVGGAATETFTVAGARTTDLAFVAYDNTDDNDYTTRSWISAANTLSVTMSANPLVAHAFNYVIIRENANS